MTPRRIADLSVHPIGLGAMPLSDPAMLAERPRALATVHAALDSGVTLVDTADIYAPDGEHFGHNEVLVGEAVRSWAGSEADRARIVIATKGGITRAPGPDGDLWGRAGTPEALGAAARASAQRLGVDVIDLYFLHRHDPTVPFAEQVGGLAAVRADGIARQIGLSNVTLAMLDRALELVGGPDEGGIAAVQNEYSARYRADADVLARCIERGIAFLPWSPLGGAVPGPRARLAVRRLRRGGRGARDLRPAGGARVAAGAGSVRDPDPRLDPARDRALLGGRRRDRAERRGGRAPVGDSARGRLGVPRRHPRAPDVAAARRPGPTGAIAHRIGDLAAADVMQVIPRGV